MQGRDYDGDGNTKVPALPALDLGKVAPAVQVLAVLQKEVTGKGLWKQKNTETTGGMAFCVEVHGHHRGF